MAKDITGAEMEDYPQILRRGDTLNAADSLRLHWPEYLMEATGLALYMFFVCIFAALLQHPASPVRHMIASPVLRRALMGLGVGTMLAAIIMTPWGKQSGGHFNPAITFTFYRLGKVKFWDALFYAMAQFFGAMSGVSIAAYVLRSIVQNDTIHYAVTAPGVYGSLVAFIAELVISFTLMSTILFVSNHKSLAQFTPYFVGVLYATYITFETPLSGMSMNPARTFGSASYISYWHALWIYFIAPTLGMLAGAKLFLLARGGAAPCCAKLHHANNKRCIFICGYETAKIRSNSMQSRNSLSPESRL
ncbi:MIP/aquaporin family protein [Granulicella mallensis]|uniref:Aquaporin Z n=1 Tax=Granulicella mallensis TaxID=940614 RepID=A0A7W7ZRH0_9BACT|nr:aquaporin [Granulicella mallensis]MBB5064785.1 aquaporin Z [Granulicella mallensis]